MEEVSSTSKFIIPWRTPVVSIALYRKMQSFGATLKFDPHLFVFNGIILTILVAFLTNIACPIAQGLVDLFYLSKSVYRGPET